MTNTFIIVNALTALIGIVTGAVVENKLSARHWKKKWTARYPDKADCISDKAPEVIGEHIIEPEDYEKVKGRKIKVMYPWETGYAEHIVKYGPEYGADTRKPEEDEYDDRYAGWEMKHVDDTTDVEPMLDRPEEQMGDNTWGNRSTPGSHQS